MKKTTITVEEITENVWVLEIIAEKTAYNNGHINREVYRNLKDAIAAMRREMLQYIDGTKRMFGDRWFFLDSYLNHVSVYDTDYKVFCDEDGLMQHIHAHIYKKEIL